MLKAFRQNEQGNVGIIFGLTAIVILGLSGMALDFGRATSAKSKLQATIDAATLAAASFSGNEEERIKIFHDYIKVNFTDRRGARYEAPQANINITEGNIVITSASLNVPTTLSKLLGHDQYLVKVHSEAIQSATDIEIVLVLDVSGSMRHTLSGGDVRIESLRAAALQLVDFIEERQPAGQKVSVAIVPFTVNVNLGDDYSHLVTNTDHSLFNGTSWAGCVMEKASPNHNADIDTTWHAYIWPPEPDSDNSCINPSNGTNSGYKTVEEVSSYGPYSGKTKGPNFNCVRHSIMPLNEDLSAVRAKINELTSEWNMGTILAPGISWGLKMLSPQAPFSEGAEYSPSVRKIMIVLTDGEQTSETMSELSCSTNTNTSEPYSFNPGDLGLGGEKISDSGPTDYFTAYGYLADSAPFNGSKGFSTQEARLNDLTLDACNTVKQALVGDGGIEIFSIAVSDSAAPGSTVYDLLQQCASNPGNLFHVNTGAEFIEAFKKIAIEATKLRISK